MANASNEKDLPEFNHEKAARLIFPERSVTDCFRAKFSEDEILVMVRDKYDLNHLMRYYQEAFFREKIHDERWLLATTAKIVSMCTNGCTPTIDFESREIWIPPERDFDIPLVWLGQKMKMGYRGKIGDGFYYRVNIYSGQHRDMEVQHALGTSILLRLVFGESEFAFYHLRHVFSKLSYQTRLSIKTKDPAKCLEEVKRKMHTLASELFFIFGETNAPELSPYKFESKSGIRTAINQTDNRTGSVSSNVWLSSFTSGEGAHKTLETDIGFQVDHNMFARENMALSQLRGVEAMNLFLVRCKQLKRELCVD